MMRSIRCLLGHDIEEASVDAPEFEKLWWNALREVCWLQVFHQRCRRCGTR